MFCLAVSSSKNTRILFRRNCFLKFRKRISPQCYFSVMDKSVVDSSNHSYKYCILFVFLFMIADILLYFVWITLIVFLFYNNVFKLRGLLYNKRSQSASLFILNTCGWYLLLSGFCKRLSSTMSCQTPLLTTTHYSPRIRVQPFG